MWPNHIANINHLASWRWAIVFNKDFCLWNSIAFYSDIYDFGSGNINISSQLGVNGNDLHIANPNHSFGNERKQNCRYRNDKRIMIIDEITVQRKETIRSKTKVKLFT